MHDARGEAEAVEATEPTADAGVTPSHDHAVREATEAARAEGEPNELGEAPTSGEAVSLEDRARAAADQEGDLADVAAGSLPTGDADEVRTATEAARAEGDPNEIADAPAADAPTADERPDHPDVAGDQGTPTGPTGGAVDIPPSPAVPAPSASPSPVSGAGSTAPAEALGDGLGSLADTWSEGLPGDGYSPEQRLRHNRPRGAEAAARADVQSRFLGAGVADDRKARLAGAWESPNRQVADAALFGEASETTREELAEMAAAVTTEDPVSRETRRETADVDVVEHFRGQEEQMPIQPAAPAAQQQVATTGAPHAPSMVGDPADDAESAAAASTHETPAPTPVPSASRTAAPVGGQPSAGRSGVVGERLPSPRRTRIMTVANQKGGVGKTTTTVNIAAALAQSGLRVLVLDLDPQGNASTALGIPHHAEVPSVYDVLVDGAPIADVVQPCPDVPNLLCAPATIDLAGAEIELVSLVAREMRLGRALTAYLRAMEDQDQRVDYVLIDCPPSLGLLTINAFVAAEEVFIPIQCEYYALEGLSQLLKNIELIKAHLNPSLHVSTILLTMYDGRTRLSAQVADEVRRHFGQQVIRSTVPRSVRISEAPSHGQTVMTYDPHSSGALTYAAAAVEIARQGAGREGDR